MANNFGFDSDPQNILCWMTQPDRHTGGGNFGTITQNNAANSLSGDRNVLATINGTLSNSGIVLKTDGSLRMKWWILRCATFGPASRLSLMPESRFRASLRATWCRSVSEPMNMDQSYWIPGYQPTSASTPIPSSSSVDQPLNRDLIYLIGREGSETHLFWPDASSVQNATVDSVSYRGSLVDPKNIFSPGGLDPSTTYYWRVDTVDQMAR